MDALNKILRKGQLTIPRELRKKLHLEEGQYVRMSVKNGSLIVKPIRVIDVDQSYVFSDKWQEKIAEAHKNYEKGSFKKAESVDELMRDLDE